MFEEFSLYVLNFYELQFKEFVYLFSFDYMGMRHERHGYAALKACYQSQPFIYRFPRSGHRMNGWVYFV